MYWNQLLIVVAACAVGAAVGFKRLLWFITVGYGLGIFTGAIADLVIGISAGNVHWLFLLQSLVFIVYGLRLGLFLLLRETKNAAYRKYIGADKKDGKKIPVFVSVFMWIYCAFFYAGEISPVFFRMMQNDYDNIVLPLIGVLLSACGMLIEALADKQKSAQKAEDPKMVATKGLYRYVRCANYFGEILMWTGVFVGGLDTFSTAGQWIYAVLSYIMIVYIMVDGAKRTEARQYKSYGDLPSYREYAAKTPILFPFLPLYHLNRFDENGQVIEKKKN